MLGPLAACAAILASGCRAIGPSNDRDWSPDQAVLPTAEISSSQATIHNIRNCAYRTADDYDVHYYDRSFDLQTVRSVDFIMVPFSDYPEGAHVFLSFGFDDGRYLAISVEVRREKGETFSAIKGLCDQYELMYVIGDERDLIQLRTNLRLDDVYLYRANASPEQARALLVDMLKRANQLAEKPEFYHLLTNNCTTNVVNHINRVRPGKIPYTYEILLPGYSDRLAYRLGLFKTDVSFERTKLKARVTKLAYIYRDDPAFSERIRQ